MSDNERFSHIRDLLEAKRFSAALEILDGMIEECCEYQEYWWLVSICHVERQDYDAAISSLETATTHGPLGIEAQVLLGKLYADKGFIESAVAIFDHLAESPKAFEHRATLIRELGRLKQYELALRLCEQATKDSPDDWQVWFAKAFYLGRRGEPKQEMPGALERALELNPNQLSVRISLVKTLEALGLHNAARDAAREIPVEKLNDICCCQSVCQLAMIYRTADDLLRWKACVRRYAYLRRRKKSDA